jgi:hypothetical protein
MAGVNVVRKGLGAIDDEFDMEFQYFPLCKPLPRVKTPFPYLPTREDWPFRRETLGGWTLTPFGGRGRLGDELVEVEGIVRHVVLRILPSHRADSLAPPARDPRAGRLHRRADA